MKTQGNDMEQFTSSIIISLASNAPVIQSSPSARYHALDTKTSLAEEELVVLSEAIINAGSAK
jgi:hypothetical protein